MASCFQLLSEEDFKNLSEIAENQNTKKSTNNWVKLYKQRAHERSININLEKIDSQYLIKFYHSFMQKFVNKIGKNMNQTVYV